MSRHREYRQCSCIAVTVALFLIAIFTAYVRCTPEPEAMPVPPHVFQGGGR